MWNPHLLFQTHAREINRYLRKCGHNHEEAADLTQDVFTRVLSADRPGCDSNLRAYLYTVARNLSTDVYRRQRIVRIDYVPAEDYLDIPDPTPSPERVISGRQQLEAMARALAELPPKTRQAFELHRLRDHTISQVAKELDLSISRAWTLVQRAGAHIRARLHDSASESVHAQADPASGKS